MCAEAISLFDLVKSAHVAVLTFFLPVQRYHKSNDITISLSLNDWNCLFDRLSGCCNIFDYKNSVSVTKLCSQKNSLITVILYFFSVGTISDLSSVKLADCHTCCNSKRNSLICRSKKDIKFKSECIMNCSRIVVTELLKL